MVTSMAASVLALASPNGLDERALAALMVECGIVPAREFEARG